MQPRTSHRLKVAGAVLGALAMVLLVIVATLVAQVSGGWDDILDRSRPEPDDPQVLAQRATVGAEVDAEVLRVIDQTVVPRLSGGRVAAPAEVRTDATSATRPSAVPGVTGPVSSCVVGQHNFKRDDAFDLSCTEARTGIVAAQRSGLEADLVVLDSAMLSAGYAPRSDQDGLTVTLEYWAELAGTPSGMGTYDIEDLPGATYVTSDGRFHVRLGFGDLAPGGPVGSADASAVAGSVSEDEYALTVTVTAETNLD